MPPPPREKPLEGQVSIIHRWDEHNRRPLLSSAPHRALMDSTVILLKEAIISYVGRDVRVCLGNPEEQLCVFGEIKPRKDSRAEPCWSSLLSGKMKVTNNISHTAAIRGPLWSGNRRGEPGPKEGPVFVVSLHSLHLSLLTNVDGSFLCTSLQSKRHLTAFFWCIIQAYVCLWCVV